MISKLEILGSQKECVVVFGNLILELRTCQEWKCSGYLNLLVTKCYCSMKHINLKSVVIVWMLIAWLRDLNDDETFQTRNTCKEEVESKEKSKQGYDHISYVEISECDREYVNVHDLKMCTTFKTSWNCKCFS